jgi:hypothetical protein
VKKILKLNDFLKMGIAPMKAQVYPVACGGHVTKVIYQIKFLTTDIS